MLYYVSHVYFYLYFLLIDNLIIYIYRPFRHSEMVSDPAPRLSFFSLRSILKEDTNLDKN